MTETPTMQAGNETGELYVDYWGTDETHKHFLPDAKQYFEFKIMDEGARTRFQKLTNTDLTVMRDNTAKVKMDPAAERHTLIKESVTNWNLFAKDASGAQGPVLFSKQMLEKWLEKAPPKIVDELELAIRKANPWMQADMTVEEIDKQIESLYDLRKDVAARAAGESSSESK